MRSPTPVTDHQERRCNLQAGGNTERKRVIGFDISQPAEHGRRESEDSLIDRGDERHDFGRVCGGELLLHDERRQRDQVAHAEPEQDTAAEQGGRTAAECQQHRAARLKREIKRCGEAPVAGAERPPRIVRPATAQTVVRLIAQAEPLDPSSGARRTRRCAKMPIWAKRPSANAPEMVAKRRSRSRSTRRLAGGAALACGSDSAEPAASGFGRRYFAAKGHRTAAIVRPMSAAADGNPKQAISTTHSGTKTRPPMLAPTTQEKAATRKAARTTFQPKKLGALVASRIVTDPSLLLASSLVPK